MLTNLCQLIDGFKDEEKGHKGSKDVLSEPGEVFDKGGSLEAGNKKRDDERPHSYPEPPGKVREVV